MKIRREPEPDMSAVSFGHASVMERNVPKATRKERHRILYQRHVRAKLATQKKLTPPVPHAVEDAPWVRMYNRLKEAA